MAGDWIRMEKSTASKPEILRIASELKCSVGDAFLLCFRFWCWCDDQSKDGIVQGVSVEMLDVLLGRPGICAALIKVDWLRARSGSLEVPHFDRHLSESAKKRGLSSKRQAGLRARPCSADVALEALPEKRRDTQGGKEKHNDEGLDWDQPLDVHSESDEKKPFDAAKAVLPPSLRRLPEFREAWQEWCKYRRSKRKPISTHAFNHQMRDLQKIGPEAAVALIHKAIAGDWQGLPIESLQAVRFGKQNVSRGGALSALHEEMNGGADE